MINPCVCNESPITMLGLPTPHAWLILPHVKALFTLLGLWLLMLVPSHGWFPILLWLPMVDHLPTTLNGYLTHPSQSLIMFTRWTLVGMASFIWNLNYPSKLYFLWIPSLTLSASEIPALCFPPVWTPSSPWAGSSLLTDALFILFELGHPWTIETLWQAVCSRGHLSQPTQLSCSRLSCHAPPTFSRHEYIPSSTLSDGFPTRLCGKGRA